MATLVAPDGTTFELAEGETLVGRGEREVGDPPKVNLGSLTGGLTVSRQHAAPAAGDDPVVRRSGTPEHQHHDS